MLAQGITIYTGLSSLLFTAGTVTSLEKSVTWRCPVMGQAPRACKWELQTYRLVMPYFLRFHLDYKPLPRLELLSLDVSVSHINTQSLECPPNATTI